MKIKKYIILLPVFVMLFSSCRERNLLESYVIDFEKTNSSYANSGYFVELNKQIENGYFGNLSGIIAFKDNQLVYEENFGYSNTETLHFIHRITQSVTALLVGIAIDKGFIPSLDSKLLDFYPYYNFTSGDTTFLKSISIHHVLTMTTGYSRNTTWQQSDSVVRTALYSYNSHLHTYHYNETMYMVLGDIIEKTSGMKVDSFASAYLFKPLGISNFKWDKHKSGLFRTDGKGEGLHLRMRDLAKIGLLYTNSGNWQGKQVVSAYWVKEAQKKWVSMEYVLTAYAPSIAYAGYGIFVKDNSAFDYLFDANTLWAYGKQQQLWMIPSHNMVVVSTGAVGAATEYLDDMVYQYFIPACNPGIAINRNMDYNCSAKPLSVTLDGNLTEWENCSSIELLYDGYETLSENDFKGKVMFAYNPKKKESIYVALDITDNLIVKETNNMSGDYLELIFDFKNTGRSYTYFVGIDGNNNNELATESNVNCQSIIEGNKASMEIEITPSANEELYHELISYRVNENGQIGVKLKFHDTDFKGWFKQLEWPIASGIEGLYNVPYTLDSYFYGNLIFME